jgi:septum formation protein
MNSILLLGSTSASRQQLLHEARIPFLCVPQSADESKCDWGMPLAQLVATIARYKMEHVMLPAAKQGLRCFVLTADTLGHDVHGVISGKPTSREDAIAKIKAAREGIYAGTAFCLDKKIYTHGVWELEQRIEKYVGGECRFTIPDAWIERYLDNSPALQASGAIAIEGYGAQFLELVHGSYTGIVGLPMYELREALSEIGFF